VHAGVMPHYSSRGKPGIVKHNFYYFLLIKIMPRTSKRIVIDPKIMVGKPVIRGTRVPVDAIIHRIALGDTVEEILQDYPGVTRKDIKAALDYAESLVRGEDILPQIG